MCVKTAINAIKGMNRLSALNTDNDNNPSNTVRRASLELCAQTPAMSDQFSTVTVLTSDAKVVILKRRNAP